MRRTGSSLDVSWPEGDELRPPGPLAPGEQERSQLETEYHVTFTDSDHETHGISPKSLDLFETFPVGRHVRLKIGIANGVEVLP